MAISTLLDKMAAMTLKIYGGVGNAQATGDIKKYVLSPQFEAGALFQYR